MNAKARVVVGRLCEQADEFLKNPPFTFDDLAGEIATPETTFVEVAEKLIPEVAEENRVLAQMIISRGARIAYEDREEILGMIREQNMARGVVLGGLAHRPKVGLEFPELDVELTEPSQSQKRWSGTEESDLWDLSNASELEYPTGMHEGKPCLPIIAHILNVRFHNAVQMRKENSCFRKLARLRQNRSEVES